MIEYFLFFIGIILLGDIMLIPLIYFGVTNSLSLSSVILVGFLGNTVADILWYWIGKYFKKGSIYRFFKIDKLQQKNTEFFISFRQRADKILFLSKFIYGVRVPVRVIYGMEELPFKAYTKINILGSIIWIILISGLAFTIDVSAEELKLYVFRGEIVFLIFFSIVLFFEIWAKKYIKKLLASKDPLSETEPPQEQQKH
jgi:membrane protein DedA with SNARE-associated domain